MKAIVFPIALTSLLTACGAVGVSFDNVKVDPDTMNKGESLTVGGKISSYGHSISNVKYSFVDAPQGITVTDNALGTDKFTWDLSSDAQLKIVTTDQAASGKYKLRIEARADDKSDSTEVSFTIR